MFDLESVLSGMLQVREQSLIHSWVFFQSPEYVSYQHRIIFYRGNFLHCLAECDDQK